MKEVLKLALEALQWSKPHKDAVITHSEAITAIVAALAQECPNLKNCKGACFQCEYFNVDTGMMEYPAAQPAPVQEPVIYQCPRCATSMQVDLTAAALAQPAQQERVQTDSLADIGAAYKDIHACLTETLQLSRKQNGHSRQPAQEPDYAYPTIEEYEEITGFKVNDTFRMGWAMARATNDVFKQMEKQNERSI
jgi:hypothetical protein